ncbi:nucleocapsid protein [Wenzhou Apodemus agrarius jeilongvirus 1]|nr:nucleocapsid protein [Wenzhou Apodemus agrarius jeilongvirus 1]WPV62454.1 MAG: nucleocapsid protein [Jingmen rodent jeilongvirus 1]
MNDKFLGAKTLFSGFGLGYTKMSKLGSVLEEFRSHKNAPPKRGILTAALQGLKKNVVIPVPMMKDPSKRFHFITFCLQLVWSARSSGAFITGAMMSLLSVFAENPGAMLRSLLNDPDIDVQIAEVADIDNDNIKLATRGRGMEAYEREMIQMASTGPAGGGSPYPFVNTDFRRLIPRSTEDLQNAIQTITVQIWILLTKAVTAIDTARDSEGRRWVKYEQQRRADLDYRLNEAWLDFARNRIASDLAVRRYMVEILIDANKAAPPKARILELICDVGNYINEAGMAGFFLTIKYGIETKYPALALNELQADLATVLSLMKCYISLGERGPYMVILEDSIQTKFSPGSYPLLWSYAMGVGAMLDRAVNNLNYSRTYLEQSFYNLGAGMVEKMEGSVNRQVAEELGLTEDQINQVKEIVKQETEMTGGTQKAQPKTQGGMSKFVPEGTEDIVPDGGDFDRDYGDETPYARELARQKMYEIGAVERSKPAPVMAMPSQAADTEKMKGMKSQISGILKKEKKLRKPPLPPERSATPDDDKRSEIADDMAVFDS